MSLGCEMTPLFAYGMSPFEDTLKRVSGKLELEQRSWNSCCRFLYVSLVDKVKSMRSVSDSTYLHPGIP